ncbi:SDR family NAD(P)-dependent oxidoreductase [Alienimonas sp. DA493]|uniref:SDR family NAD(P)-dependent oxidoreductase n=1 Tax=Alienimonas sp. DA493 TaxID=3373605 RepID=UPI003753ECC5
MLDDYADRRALVTGASSGLGAAYARTLAARGMHLVLVARREGRLRDLAAELDAKHRTRCEVIAADLSKPGEVARVADAAAEDGHGVELLVNNAGFAIAEDVPHTNRADALAMVDLNVRALTDLTYRFLPPMLARGHGAVLNVASVAAFTPVAYMGAYAASKAYVLHFSEALWAEARDRGVTVTACCPGPTRTEFFDVAGVQGWLQKRRALDPETVVRRSLRAMEKQRPVAVIGWKEKLQTLAVRLAPRRVCVLESRKYFRPKHRDADPRLLSAAEGAGDEPVVDSPSDHSLDSVKRAG